ncbi:MAG: GAF domain-containing protein [Candidatus Eiseniibacteriota bacterium]
MSAWIARPLARQIALLVGSVLVAGAALKVELHWTYDQARYERERLVAAGKSAHRLADLLAEPHHHSADAPDFIRSLTHASPDLTVDLVDASGTRTWSSAPGLSGARHPLGAALASGLAVGGGTSFSDGRRRLTAVQALERPGAHAHDKTLLRGRPVAVVLTWDTSAEAAERFARRLWQHAITLAYALAASLFLWWALGRLVSRPLVSLIEAANRHDVLPEDLAPFACRPDELGSLARTLEEARRHLDARGGELAERSIRLSNALNAGYDGIAMASWRDGEWIFEHVNGTLATLVGKPAAWFEGRTVAEGLASLRSIIVNADEVSAWVAHSLGEPGFEGTIESAFRDPAAPPDHPEPSVTLTEITTRPFSDTHGRLSGRLWVVRDVTRVREHEERLRRQNQELAGLDVVGRRIARSLDADAILTGALEALHELFEASFGLGLRVSERDAGGAVRSVGGDIEASPELLEALRRLLRPDEVVIVPDIGAVRGLRAHLPKGLATVALLPLADSTGLVGALVLGRGRTSPFGEEERGLLRRVVHPIDVALENARLFARTQAQLAENQTLFEVSRSMVRAEDLDAVLRDILSVVHARLDYRNAAILLPDEAGRALYVRASVGYHGNLRSLDLPVDGTSVTARCFRSGRPFNVPDVREQRGYVAGSDDIRSELALPLAIGTRVLGILDVESDRPAAFGPDDERLLAAVASQAAIVLQNASLIDDARARALRLEAVNEIARSVSSTLDPSRLDRAVVTQLARIVPGDRLAVLRYDAARRRIVRSVVLDARTGLAHDGDDLSWTFDKGIDPATLTPHQAEIWTRRDDPDGAAEARAIANGLASMVLVPIALDGVVAASIVVASAREDGFTSEQIRRLEMVSYHVAVALKNAELFSRLQASYIQLNEAQDGLVRSEKLRALGEMASGVAHDFNNVLGAILARAQLLRQDLAGTEAEEELEVIEKAALDGASTVRRLQDFTRVRTDRTFQAVGMAQLVEDCVSLTRGRWRDEAERAGLHYEVITTLDPVPDVAGQASELREVLTNLILNALDAMPRGGRLQLSTRRVAGELGEETIVEVRDAGEGMSPETRARIFDPFFTTKGVRGVGLGLSVAYGIVQRHGGRIEVESAPGAGTTMRVRLPADVAATSARAAAPASPASPAIRADGPPGTPPGAPPGAASSPSLSILVIDDEPNVRSLLADLLRTAGYRVTAVASGRDALTWLDAQPECDLVLTDLGMPDLSGWDVARALLGRPQAPPVILVTGWGIQLDDHVLPASGVSGVIAKPFTIEDVLDAVDRVMRGRRPERDAA